MSKRTLLLVAILLFAAFAATAQVSLKITHIGAGNLYRSMSPVGMEVEVTNTSSGVADFDLVTYVRSSSPIQYRRKTNMADNFRVPVRLERRETKRVSFPVILRVGWYADSEKPLVSVDAVTKDGKVLGQTKNEYELRVPAASHVLYLLCNNTLDSCGRLQQTIAGSGTEEQINRKSSQLQLLTFSQLPSQWWEYAPTDFVVVGKPLSEMTAEQRDGLAGFLYSGGSVILCENNAGEKDWLASFRQGPPTGEKRAVGTGKLYRVERADSAAMEKIFNDLVSDSANSGIAKYAIDRHSNDYPVSTFLDENAERFDFPTPRWLIIWLIAYILVVAPLSFFLLRRLRKLEWGWVSIAAISVLFGLCMYGWSSAKRPKHAHADEAALYHMDQGSSLAAVSYGTQLSTPDRVTMNVSVPGHPVLQSIPSSLVEAMAAELPADLTDRSDRTDSVTVRLGAKTELPVNLLRWSTQTLFWKDVQKMQGTVTFRDGILENSSGVDFRDSLYVDWSTGDVYLLGKISSGTKMDLNKKFHVSTKTVEAERRVARHDAKKDLPFDLRDVLLTAPEAGRAFYGLADGPTLGVKTDNPGTEHRSAALFIVDMEQR